MFAEMVWVQPSLFDENLRRFFQVLLIFMQRMEMLLSKTPPTDVKNDVLPMVYRALESDASQIQELCLSIIPGFAGRFSSSVFYV